MSRAFFDGSRRRRTQGTAPVVTIAVPTLNQGRYLEAALESILSQDLPLEIFVADGGSSDNTRSIIDRHQDRLSDYRSRADEGQASAINECIAQGSAPFVAWLNSDDLYLPGALRTLVDVLHAKPAAPAAYGKVRNIDDTGRNQGHVWTEHFSRARLAVRCIVSQPGALIRRKVWESVGGVDPRLDLAFDYDLWWRIDRDCGPPEHVELEVACNRNHPLTKTRLHRKRHYLEAMAIVNRHHGRIPLKWWLAWPYAVWWRSLLASHSRLR